MSQADAGGPVYRQLEQAEFMDPPGLRAVQSAYWGEQSRWVAASSAFYRRHFGARSLPPDLDGIADLPFTDKEMLRRDQDREGGFGSYLAVDDTQVTRIHRTSGTTGTAMNLALTRQDATLTADVGGRAQRAAGLGPGHRVVHCLNYQLWMGGYTDHATLETTGAAVVPFGVGNSELLVRTILELGITAISCTPSYPAVLERVIADSFPGLSPRDLGLELGLFGGEPGLDDPGLRARLENTWGFAVRNANYGVTDILCNFAGQTAADNDLCFMAHDVLFAELVDPAGESQQPWKAGESGELVLTHLCKQAQPLVRFRTGDIITLTGTGPAACGRTATRFRVSGRRDDMVVVRGINVFPVMVAAVINTLPELSTEYRIHLESPPPHDRLPLQVELANPGIDPSGLDAELASRIKESIGVSADVTLLEAGSLPRTAGKTRRLTRDY